MNRLHVDRITIVVTQPDVIRDPSGLTGRLVRTSRCVKLVHILEFIVWTSNQWCTIQLHNVHSLSNMAGLSLTNNPAVNRALLLLVLVYS